MMIGERIRLNELLKELDDLVWNVAHGEPFDKNKFYDWIHQKARPVVDKNSLEDTTSFGCLGGR